MAVGYALKSARLFRTLGMRNDEANALNAMGWHHAMLGDFESARELCGKALGMLTDGKDRRNVTSAVLHSLGYIAKKTGQYPEALGYLRRSIPVYHDIGDAFAEANAWDEIAGVHAAMADTSQAEHAWRNALAMFEAQNRAMDAERVMGRLNALELSTPPRV
jgi:tetratricopeptide (TPR) repeat protein